ncbi:MAG TPA: TonB-dependent receptor [Chitinophagaceae bacterium]
MLKRVFQATALIFAIPLFISAQETNSSIGGIVKSGAGEVLVGATITATHIPTGTSYRVVARAGGRYDINNMTPGGPYLIVATFVGFQDEKREDVYLTLGEKGRFDFALVDKSGNLTELVVTTRRASNQGKGGTETGISLDKVTNMPTVSRSLSDYLRYTPQAKITGDGGVSIAGQNNRYNAFYIDGAINNDVFGLAASGTNGGQANINPISIDAIDQFQVVISPYDASIGGFTGGGINATTRSGTNTLKGSAWYYYRNENLAGTTPGNLPDASRTKLPDLKNSNVGLRIGGPIVKNKLFFFILGELQRDKRPQLFSFAEYRGIATQDSINKLVNFLNTTHTYDPGGYLDIPEKVNANRIQVKLDWNLNTANRLSLSYRFNDGTRYNTTGGSSTRVNFFNNGYLFPNTTNTFTAELKSTFKRNSSNRLLVTYTNVEDNRDPIGEPFPRVTIFDGAGQIIFGTENFSTGNYLLQKNFTIYDAYKFSVKNHSFTVGADILSSSANNLFIRDLYGTYTYNSLNDFITNARPNRYDRSFSLLEQKTDETNSPSAAKFKYYNLAFFVNDEIKATDKLTLNFGLRADKTIFPDDPQLDPFFNDTAVAAISQHYDMHGARSGQMAKVNWSISPRVGFVYKIPEDNLTIRGGVGYFTGRMPLVWPGGVYNNTGVNLGTLGVNNPNITFRADPFNQYGPADFGLNLANSKGQVDLISEEFKLPRLFRASFGVDKNLGKGWNVTVEGLYSKNINEIYYQNINIIDSNLMSVGPGARHVYSFSGAPQRISMRPGGPNNGNPYAGGEIFLLYNNPDKDQRGFSYTFTALIDKKFSKGFAATLSYTYGSSMVLNEGTSSQNNSQWRFMETVNGRNFVKLSTSDFDLAHRIYGYVSKKFSYSKEKFATTVSLVLNSQSGQPFSYVYNGSIVGDRARGETNDLIYIPTASEVQSMIFLTNTVNGVAYSQAEQRTLFENYIQGNEYLNKHRGQFSERNGDRLPWQTLLDLKIQQDFNIKLSRKTYTFQISYDVYNFTNMLSKKWGQTYFLANDAYALVQFAGFVSPTNLTPQYRFSPQTGKPWGLSTSNSPGLSARWISQLGIRVIF